MKNKDFCFVVFSHTGTQEKEELLNRSLNSLKSFDLPIILISHLPVSSVNQNLVDYFLKDTDNLIVDESDIINPSNDHHIADEIYYVHDFYGGIQFSTNTFKKTYQPGVFNLYINSINLVRNLGFKNLILWEFDFILGEKSVDNFRNIIRDYKNGDYKYFYFHSNIQNLPCMHAIPTIINVDLLSWIFPGFPIKNPKDFVTTSNLMIMEQWMLANVKKTGERGLIMDYNNIDDYLPDSSKGKVDSQNGNYLFFNLRSGIYFSRNSPGMIYYTSNSSKIKLKSSLEIRDSNRNFVIYEKSHLVEPNWWSFDHLPQDVIDLSYEIGGINIVELVEEIDTGNISQFKYTINSENRDYVSRLKSYSV